jgi:glycosyltransferase involved in cell wall biosynthesis
MAATCDVFVCGLLLDGTPAREQCEGVQFVRFPLGADYRLAKFAQRFSVFRNRNTPEFASPIYRRIYAERAALYLRRRRCSAIHIFNQFQYVSVMRRLNPNARIVLHMHCEWLVQLDRALVDCHLEQADVIAGCSDYVTDGVRIRFPHHAQRCVTIYNGVDTSAFSPNVATQKAGSQRILFVSRISPEKGVHVLLKAFEKVAQHRPQAVLEMVGPNAVLAHAVLVALCDNSEIRDLERFYTTRYSDHLQRLLTPNCDGRVVFSGELSRNAVVERLRQAAVLVQPSLYEVFGMAIVEAMACGVPVVASAVGGIPELVRNGSTGLLVEPNDPPALADAILRLLDDRQLSCSMGAQGRARAQANFSWERTVDTLLSCYFKPKNRSVSIASLN